MKRSISRLAVCYHIALYTQAAHVPWRTCWLVCAMRSFESWGNCRNYALVRRFRFFYTQGTAQKWGVERGAGLERADACAEGEHFRRASRAGDATGDSPSDILTFCFLLLYKVGLFVTLICGQISIDYFILLNEIRQRYCIIWDLRSVQPANLHRRR